jgi:hypothetical protein
MNPAYFGPGFAAVPNVCFWHLADIPVTLSDVRYLG